MLDAKKGTNYLLLLLFLGLIGTLIASMPAFAATSIKYGWIALDANKNSVLAGSQYYLSSGKSQPVAWITNGVTVQKVTDKSVVYLNNTKTGTAQALVIGDKVINGYKDAFITTFTIVNKPSTTNTNNTTSNKSNSSSNTKQSTVKTDLSKATVVVNKKGYYANGYDAVKPSFTIKINGKTLKAGTDYYVAGWKNNKTPGKTAKVTFKGKGNYKGSVSTNFKLVYLGDELARFACEISWSTARNANWSPKAKEILQKFGFSTTKSKIYCSLGVRNSVYCSGFDKGFRYTKEFKKKYGTKGSASFHKYMKDSSKWKSIGTYQKKKDKLMPGDVLVYSDRYNHICMYVGKTIPQEVYKNRNKDSKIKQAYSKKPTSDSKFVSAHRVGCRANCVCNASWAGVKGNFHIYRCIKPDATQYRVGQPVK